MTYPTFVLSLWTLPWKIYRTRAWLHAVACAHDDHLPVLTQDCTMAVNIITNLRVFLSCVRVQLCFKKASLPLQFSDDKQGFRGLLGFSSLYVLYSTKTNEVCDYAAWNYTKTLPADTNYMSRDKSEPEKQLSRIFLSTSMSKFCSISVFTRALWKVLYQLGDMKKS